MTFWDTVSMASSPEPAQAPRAPVVMRLPLEVLQLPDGSEFRRGRDLDAAAIRPLLRFGSPVVMVVASVAKPLRWFADDEMRAFWEADARSRIAALDREVHLEDYPGGRLYWASLWTDEATGRAVITLEEAH